MPTVEILNLDRNKNQRGMFEFWTIESVDLPSRSQNEQGSGSYFQLDPAQYQHRPQLPQLHLALAWDQCFQITRECIRKIPPPNQIETIYFHESIKRKHWMRPPWPDAGPFCLCHHLGLKICYEINSFDYNIVTNYSAEVYPTIPT